jgi:hypothetical protein
LLAPAKGYVEINGLRRRSSEATELRIRKQVAFLSDHPWLPEFMTVREWLLANGQVYDVDQDQLLDHMALPGAIAESRVSIGFHKDQFPPWAIGRLVDFLFVRRLRRRVASGNYCIAGRDAGRDKAADLLPQRGDTL